MRAKITMSSTMTWRIIFEDSGRLVIKVLNKRVYQYYIYAYLCRGASRVAARNLGCARSTDSLFVQRRDEFYFCPAVASRDLDAIPHYISLFSAAADTRKSKAAACDRLRGYFDNARTVSNIIICVSNGRLQMKSTRESLRLSEYPTLVYIYIFFSSLIFLIF